MMPQFHSCKTTTVRETILQGADITAHRHALAAKLADYGFAKTYRSLLHAPPQMRLLWDREPFAVTMKRNALSLYVIHAQIGQKSYRFILDTGAQISAIRPAVAAAHRAKQLPGTLSVGSVGGRQEAMHGYLIPRLQLGRIIVCDLPMIALTTNAISFHTAHWDFSLFDGILGWDILSQFDFELDDVGHRFKVLNNRYRFAHPNMIRTTFPLFLLRDQKANLLTMGFDSGARLSWVNKERMSALGYALSSDKTALGFGVHGLEEMRVATLLAIRLYLYRAQIHMKHVHTGRTDIFPHVCLDGILGNEIFRNRRMRIVSGMEMVLLA